MANWNQSRMLYIYAGDGDGWWRLASVLEVSAEDYAPARSLSICSSASEDEDKYASCTQSTLSCHRPKEYFVAYASTCSKFCICQICLCASNRQTAKYVYIYMHGKHMWQTLSLNAHNDWRKTLFTFMTWQRVLMHIHIIVCDYIEKYAAAAYTPYNVFESNI